MAHTKPWKGAVKLTKPQVALLRIVRDRQYMPERTRGVGDRLEALGLVQNMYTAMNVWLITQAGLDALAQYPEDAQ